MHDLPRVLSKRGALSRAQAVLAVRAGRVTLDDEICRDPERLVDPLRARIALDGRPVPPRPTGEAGGFTWWALNKPRGVVTTTRDPEGRRTVMDLLPAGGARGPAGVAPVGRLDADSAGLLLLTDEHALAARLLAPESHVTKCYRVKVRGHPDAETLARLQTETVVLEGLALGPMGVTVTTVGPRSAWLEVRLSEGKNRQIRRRLAHAGHAVEVLVRTAFGPIALGDLEPGALRPLTAEERAALRAAAGG